MTYMSSTFQSPLVTEIKHQRNQVYSPVNTVSPRKRCFGHRCNGRHRSIQQFKNKDGLAIFEFCALCRGRK